VSIGERGDPLGGIEHALPTPPADQRLHDVEWLCDTPLVNDDFDNTGQGADDRADIVSAKGGRKFWVKWKGFKHADNTWEPEGHLIEGSADLIKAFDARLAEKLWCSDKDLDHRPCSAHHTPQPGDRIAYMLGVYTGAGKQWMRGTVLSHFSGWPTWFTVQLDIDGDKLILLITTQNYKGHDTQAGCWRFIDASPTTSTRTPARPPSPKPERKIKGLVNERTKKDGCSGVELFYKVRWADCEASEDTWILDEKIPEAYKVAFKQRRDKQKRDASKSSTSVLHPRTGTHFRDTKVGAGVEQTLGGLGTAPHKHKHKQRSLAWHTNEQTISRSAAGHSHTLRAEQAVCRSSTGHATKVPKMDSLWRRQVVIFNLSKWELETAGGARGHLEALLGCGPIEGADTLESGGCLVTFADPSTALKAVALHGTIARGDGSAEKLRIVNIAPKRERPPPLPPLGKGVARAGYGGGRSMPSPRPAADTGRNNSSCNSDNAGNLHGRDQKDHFQLRAEVSRVIMHSTSTSATVSFKDVAFPDKLLGAAKELCRNGVTLTIWATCRETSDSILCRWRGCGITAEDLQRFFSPIQAGNYEQRPEVPRKRPGHPGPTTRTNPKSWGSDGRQRAMATASHTSGRQKGSAQDAPRGVASEWWTAVDPESGHLYYTNARTQEWQWQKPTETCIGGRPRGEVVNWQRENGSRKHTAREHNLSEQDEEKNSAKHAPSSRPRSSKKRPRQKNPNAARPFDIFSE
jgi:hypothetical protein